MKYDRRKSLNWEEEEKVKGQEDAINNWIQFKINLLLYHNEENRKTIQVN